VTTNCQACGAPVNDAVVKCPHCGEKQERSAPVYSKAEVQALLDTDEALQAHTGSSGLLKALLLPHKHTRGLMRVLEIVLAALAAPAVLTGAICIFLVARRRPGRVQGVFSTTGELASVVVMTLLGGIPIAMWLGGSYAFAAIGALWARAGVRMISAGRAERSLIEADQKAPRSALAPSRAQAPSPAQRVSSQELPAARLLSAPSRPSRPPLAATAASSSTAAAFARPASPPATAVPPPLVRASSTAAVPAAPAPSALPSPFARPASAPAMATPSGFAPPPSASDSRPSAPSLEVVDPAKARAAAQAQSQPRAATSPDHAMGEPGDEPSILR
jgi:hypothetical protein